ncbi:hypothetical protein cgisf_2915 [Corynebacterium glutamicum]|nr:hypothetical protein cgisf_2915 [Corynebacterium glutamicum]
MLIDAASTITTLTRRFEVLFQGFVHLKGETRHTCQNFEFFANLVTPVWFASDEVISRPRLLKVRPRRIASKGLKLLSPDSLPIWKSRRLKRLCFEVAS